jgi:branched-chain amino acid transport system ATP-binding protein
LINLKNFSGKGLAMLEIKGLTKHFGGLAAVDGLDLNVSKREIVGIIVPNGAGKTTAFNLITGFLRPTKGKVVFDGQDVTGQKPHFVAGEGIVRTFQATSVFPDFTVLQNIMAAYQLKPKVGFWEAAFHTPSSRRKEEYILDRALEIVRFVGLDNAKNMPARSLPHGHQRILGIAIALAAEPKLLLLDEPLSGMNAEEVNNAKSLIHRIWQRGITILLIEHNMGATMSLCQRIAVLNFGNKIAEGSPDQIKQNKEVIQAYLGTVEYAT